MCLGHANSSEYDQHVCVLAAEGLSDEQAAACLAWVQHLVRENEVGKKRKGKDAAAAATSSWQCSGAQVQALLAASMKAPSGDSGEPSLNVSPLVQSRGMWLWRQPRLGRFAV